MLRIGPGHGRTSGILVTTPDRRPMAGKAQCRRYGRLTSPTRLSQLRPERAICHIKHCTHEVAVDVVQKGSLYTCLTGARDRQETGCEVA
jgi:hypothetical protein